MGGAGGGGGTGGCGGGCGKSKYSEVYEDLTLIRLFRR